MDKLLFAFAIGQSLLVGLMLVMSPDRGRRQVLYLVAILWCFAGLFAVVLARDSVPHPWMLRLDIPIGLLLGPLLMLHASASMGRRTGAYRHDAIWLLPVLPGVLYAAGVAMDAGLLRATMLLLITAALAWSVFALSGHIRRYDDINSVDGPQRMVWLRRSHWIIAAIVATGLAQNLAESANLRLLATILIYPIPLGFIVLSTYIAVSLMTVLPIDARALPESEGDRRPQMDELELDRVQAQLESAMTETKLYREPALQLRALSEKTGIPEHLVTEAIRRGLADHFFDYVNGHRIRDAMSRLTGTGASVTAIMLATGFGSKSSFYTEFRKRTGQTPSEYRADD